MRRWIVLLLIGAAVVSGTVAVLRWRESSGPRYALTVAPGARNLTVLDPERPFPLDPVPAGWRHRTFWFTPPMKLSFASPDGVAALRCETNAGGSIYGRFTDIDLASLPLLVWRWNVEVPVPTGFDERERAGDDHPVRFYVELRAGDGSAHRAEIIWSNGAFRRGDYKLIGTFPHLVADGGSENVGVWRDESVDLVQMYRDIAKRSDTPRLTFLGIFCDSDNTRTRTVAYTGKVQLQAR